ncbi:hypothetical protein K493DRAFT_314321 [Basidiobolus meristosporus CBS 931.73]|uniref:Uncharacterized protein n=1 Tax=Basidiobolus meristosporus CBS 931.73 TaxID=1314790 RepID=A0A1Y1YGE0_9FUNG|nr:hypothetical protein K493DRAFT_314321 [Basidiobolus meristosporus CBS 931.73]|eukprot:ORX96816.1 hypothetical protein K493DRAFT_314321 [Basidiobolus meristosporus CBS 931.73]
MRTHAIGINSECPRFLSRISTSLSIHPLSPRDSTIFSFTPAVLQTDSSAIALYSRPYSPCYFSLSLTHPLPPRFFRPMLSSRPSKPLESRARCSVNKSNGGWFLNGEGSIVSEVSQVVCNETVTINSGSSSLAATSKPRLRKYKSIDLLSKYASAGSSTESERKSSLRRMSSIDILQKYFGSDSQLTLARFGRSQSQNLPSRLSEYVSFPLHDDETDWKSTSSLSISSSNEEKLVDDKVVQMENFDELIVPMSQQQAVQC